MSVYSLNQVRHLYVANKSVETTVELANIGDFKVKTCGNIEKEVYFEVQGPDTVLKSDYIPVKNINYVNVLKAAAMATPMKKVKVVLDPTVNGGNPIAGQDYVLRINFHQFFGMGAQDQYVKDAAVHARKGMTAEQFYKELVKALNLSFSREVRATATSNPYLKFTANADSIEIEEVPQSWTLGTEAQERVLFDVMPTTVYDGVDDLIWGTVTSVASTTMVGNGKKMADLEYFLLGERGDQYRKVGFPNDIETKGMIDPSKEYDVIEIHYAFTDTGVNSYRTEKDITIAVPSEGGETFVEINKIIAAFNTATGLTVKPLAKADGE